MVTWDKEVKKYDSAAKKPETKAASGKSFWDQESANFDKAGADKWVTERAATRQPVSNWLQRYDRLVGKLAEHEATANGRWEEDVFGGYGKALDTLIDDYQGIRPSSTQGVEMDRVLRQLTEWRDASAARQERMQEAGEVNWNNALWANRYQGMSMKDILASLGGEMPEDERQWLEGFRDHESDWGKWSQVSTDQANAQDRQEQYQRNLTRIDEINAILADEETENALLTEGRTAPAALIREREQLQQENTAYERGGLHGADSYLAAVDQEALNRTIPYYNGGTTDRLGAYLQADGSVRQNATALVSQQQASIDMPINPWDSVVAGFSADEMGLAQNYIAGDKARWDLLDQNEIQMYYYLQQSVGQDAADEYLNSMTETLQRRGVEQMNEQVEGLSTGWRVLANAESIVLNLAGGIQAAEDDVVRMIAGQDVQPYNEAHFGANYVQAIRGTTQKSIEEWAEGLTSKDGEPEDEEHSWFAKLAGNTYQAIMSGMDSALGATLFSPFGGGAVNGYDVVMGLSAASQRAKELYDQGASRSEIALGAAGAGFLEAFFEHFSIDKFFESFLEKPITGKGLEWIGKFLSKVLVQGGVEASEEVATEVGNIVWDSITRAYGSDISQQIRAYMDDGATEEEARRMALRDKAGEIFWAAYGGFVSGAGMGLVGGAANQGRLAYHQVQDQRQMGASIIQQGTASDVIASGQEAGVDQRLLELAQQKAAVTAQQYQQMSGREQRQTARALGRVAEQTVQRQQETAHQQERAHFVEETTRQLEERGVENPKAAAEALAKREFDDKRLTRAERALLAKLDEQEQTKDITKEVRGSEEYKAFQRENAKPVETTLYNTFDSRNRNNPARIAEQRAAVEEASGKYADPQAMVSTFQEGQNALQFDEAYENAYRIGLTGQAQANAVESLGAAYLTEEQRIAAWEAGRKAAENGKAEGSVRQGIQWNDRADSRQQTQGVEGSTAESRQAGSQTEGSTERIPAGKAVSTQDLNLKDGTENKNLYIVPRSEWKQEWVQAEQRAKERGLKLEIVQGGMIETIDRRPGKQSSIIRARGLIIGDRIIITASDPEFSVEQILEHEMGHDKIDRGEISLEDVRKELRNRYTEEQILDIIDMYIGAYQTDTRGMTDAEVRALADDILKEIICDSLGKMNVFANREDYKKYRGTVGVFLRDTRVAAQQTQKNRGARTEEKNTAVDGGVVKYSTAIDTNPANHTAEKQRMIDEYVNAVDMGLRDFVEGAISGEGKTRRYELKPVNEKAGKEIEAIVGFNPSGYKTVLEKRMAEHINKRHGEAGAANKSMSDLNDVARIQFVIDNYDNIEYAGKSSAYVYMDENGKNRQADTIKYTKSVDGMYYVVEAVARTNKQTVYIISAYLQKNKNKTETSQSVPTKNGQPHTPESAIANESASNGMIQQGREEVKPKFSFAGIKSRTADVEARDRARELEANGIEAEEIRKETGWFRGADGRWRYEISDKDAEVYNYGDAELAKNDPIYKRFRELRNKVYKAEVSSDELEEYFNHLDLIAGKYASMKEMEEKLKRGECRLPDIYDNPALYEAYPELKSIRVVFEEMEESYGGYYDKYANKIAVKKRHEHNGKNIKWVLAHEIQHAIQAIEGFQDGSNPLDWESRLRRIGYGEKDPYILYWNTAGEIEARDVAARMDLDEQQRRERRPYIGDENTVFPGRPWKKIAKKSRQDNVRFSRVLQTEEDLREQNSYLKEQLRSERAKLKNAKAQMELTEKQTANREDVRAVAVRILSQYGSSRSKTETAKRLQVLADYIVGEAEPDYKELQGLARDTAEYILKGSAVDVNMDQQEMLRDVLFTLGTMKIHVNDSLKAETGDWKSFRQKNRNRMRFAKDGGTSMEAVWRELQDTYGQGMFPDDVMNPGDQLMYLDDLLDSLRPDFQNPYKGVWGQTIEQMSIDIIDQLMSSEVRQAGKTRADRIADRARAQAEEVIRDMVDEDFAVYINDRAEAIAGKEIARLRNRQEKQLRNQRNKLIEQGRAREQDRIRRQQESDTRNKIQKLAERMERLAKNSGTADTKHVNPDMMRGLAKFLAAFKETQAISRERRIQRLEGNMQEFKNAAEQLAEFQRMLAAGEEMPSGWQKEMQRLSKLLEANQKAKSALDEAAAKYRAMAQNNEVYFDEEVDRQLQQIVEMMRGKTLYDLDAKGLDTVYKGMKGIYDCIVNANKAFSLGQDKTISGSAERMASAIRQVNYTAPGMKSMMQQFMQWQMNPDVFFDFICGFIKGNEGKVIQAAFARGTERMLEVQREYYENFKELTESKDKAVQADMAKLMNPNKKEYVSYGLKDLAGNEVQTSRGMMMQVHMMLKQKDSFESLLHNGFRLPNAEVYYKGKTDAAYGSMDDMAMLSEGLGEDYQELVKQRKEIHEKMDAAGDTLTQEQKDEYFQQLDDLRKRAEPILAARATALAQMESKIEGMLNRTEKRLIELADQWYARSGRMMRDVYMQMYGFEPKLNENYVPIHRDPQSLMIDIRDPSQAQKALNLENSGFTKERVHSYKPILLTDFIVELEMQKQKMSRYVGFAMVQRDFMKIWKVDVGNHRNVNQLVAARFGQGKQVFGVSGEEYVNHYIAAIAGGHSSDNVFNMFYGNYAAAVLRFNPRVAVSQAASIPTAAAVVGWKNMAMGVARGLKNAGSTNYRNELAAKNAWFYQRYRGLGGATELADMRSRGGMINQVANSKVGKALFNWCQAVDVFSTGSIMWEAAAAQVESQGMKPGQEGYDAAVNEKYTEIIRRSQPNYTTTERSDLLRDQRAGMKMLTQFRTQSNQNLNLLMAANGEFGRMKRDFRDGKNGVVKADVDAARAKLVNAYTGVILGGTGFFVFLRGLVNFILGTVSGYRDKETDEVTVPAMLAGVGKEIASSLLGTVAFGGQVYDILNSIMSGENYYGLTDSAFSSISDFGENWWRVITNARDKDKEVTPAQIRKALESSGMLVGIPAGNAGKVYDAITMWVKDIMDGKFFRYESDKTKNAQYRARVVKYVLAGDTERANDALAMLWARSSEDNDEDAQKAERSEMKTYLKKLYFDGDMTDLDAVKVMTHIGVDDPESVIDRWDFMLENDDEKNPSDKMVAAYNERGNIDGKVFLEAYHYAGKHKKAEIIEYIQKLRLSAAQKKKLYQLVTGWSLKGTPWE